MLTEKGRQKGETSALELAFRYHPARPAVIWADSTEDMSDDDWTRGSNARAFTMTSGPSPFVRITLPDSDRVVSFPRLAREHPCWYEGQSSEHLDGSGVVVRTLARLWDHVTDISRFKREVLKAVPIIGLLDPDGVSDTLSDWAMAAFEAKYWMEYLKDLNMFGNSVPNDFQDVLCERWSNVGNPYSLGVKTKAEEFWCEAVRSWLQSFPVEKVINSLTPHDARVALGRFWLERFMDAMNGAGIESRPSRIILRPEGKVFVLGGALDWAYFELSMLYRTATVKVCPCGLSFSSRGGYCSRTCKLRFKKRRQRNNSVT